MLNVRIFGENRNITKCNDSKLGQVRGKETRSKQEKLISLAEFKTGLEYGMTILERRSLFFDF